jgi:hypothetical protein
MADTLDVLTLAEAKAALNIPASNNDYDTELAQVVTAASRFIDDVFGPVVQRTITDERHDGYAGTVDLDHAPVVSITSVKEYSGGTASTLTAETETIAGTYRVDLEQGIIYRRSTWVAYRFASQSVVVTYVAGRAATTAAVDAKFKEAGAIAAIHLWQHRGSGNGIGVVGGDGERFGNVPFSSDVLRRKLLALFPADARIPGIA